MKKRISFIITISFINILVGQNVKNLENINEIKIHIDSLIGRSNSSDVFQESRDIIFSQAFDLSKQLRSDSLKMDYLSSLSYHTSSTRNNELFRKINFETIKLAKALNDSIVLANAFWDLGYYYSRNSIKDSAYYSYSKAQKIYETKGNSYLSGRMLYNMAYQQLDVKDYTNSEATVIAAIENLKPLKKHKELYNCYNTLAIISQNLGEYKQALNYYDVALEYIDKMGNPEDLLRENTNNRGVIYREMGELKKARDYFQQNLEVDSLLYSNPSFYAKTLVNIVSIDLKLNDTSKIAKHIQKAIRINDSLQDTRGLASSYVAKAEYNLYKGDTLAAIGDAITTVRLAKESASNERLLETYALLAQIDNQNASKHAKNYIKLNDSIQNEDRQARNRFARIRFETDEFIAENEQLEEETETLERQKQIWTGIALGFFLLGISVYVIINQRVKNQKLQFLQQQQVNNQEIFNLMLTQKQKVDEVKRMEQKRISEELHDGVLGKMLGARMVLTGLNKKTGDEVIEARMEAIKALKNVEEEVRSISHELSHSAYQKLNNFVNSIDELLSSVKLSSNIVTTFNYDEDEDYDALKGEIKINVYRMIQECLQNAVKHSGGKNFFVNFDREDELLIVEMGDDGKGFNLEKERKGIGMRNIKSRVEKLNGKWFVDSEPQKGTKITLEIPLYYTESDTKDKLQHV